MKIIILTTAFDYGGAEKHGLLLAEYLKITKGFNVEYWAFQKGDNSIGLLCEKIGINTQIIGLPRRFGNWFYPFQVRKEAMKFRDFNPDVIITFNTKANVYGGFIAKYTSAKCVVWSQQTTENLKFLRPIECKMMINNHCFISNSEHGTKYLINEYKIPTEKTFFVKNGFTHKKTTLYTKEKWLEKLGLKNDIFKVIKVAHLESRKDHLTLLKAWQIVVFQMRKKKKEPILILAGKLGLNSNKLIQFTLELDIFKNVLFLGKVKDISGLLQIADLSVMSSNVEGMPNSIVEAMYAGLPIVANDIPGNREAVGKVNYPYLSKNKDYKDLADKILLFGENKRLREEVGKVNLAFAEREYVLDGMGEKTWEIIQNHL